MNLNIKRNHPSGSAAKGFALFLGSSVLLAILAVAVYFIKPKKPPGASDAERAAVSAVAEKLELANRKAIQEEREKEFEKKLASTKLESAAAIQRLEEAVTEEARKGALALVEATKKAEEQAASALVAEQKRTKELSEKAAAAADKAKTETEAKFAGEINDLKDKLRKGNEVKPPTTWTEDDPAPSSPSTDDQEDDLAILARFVGNVLSAFFGGFGTSTTYKQAVDKVVKSLAEGQIPSGADMAAMIDNSNPEDRINVINALLAQLNDLPEGWSTAKKQASEYLNNKMKKAIEELKAIEKPATSASKALTKFLSRYPNEEAFTKAGAIAKTAIRNAEVDSVGPHDPAGDFVKAIDASGIPDSYMAILKDAVK